MSDQKPGPSRFNMSSLDLSQLPRGAIGMRGLPMGRNSRLPSIRSPRDLTLGGSQKKTFVPNIPARREKKTEQVDDGKATRDVKKVSATNTRGRGRGQRGFVQLPGTVFGQGVASVPKPVTDKKTDFKPIAPSIIKSEPYANSFELPIKKEKPEVKLENLSSDSAKDELDSDDDDENYNMFGPPVNLPIGQDTKLSQKFRKGKKPNKYSRIIVEESEDSSDENEPANFKELFESTNGQDRVICFDLPNTVRLALQSKELNTDVAQKSAAQTSSESSTKQQPPSVPPWTSCVDGHVGKLQLLKSGRARLVLGDCVLDDVVMYRSPMYQELVSACGNSNGYDLSIIGQVKHKLKVTSDIENQMIKMNESAETF